MNRLISTGLLFTLLLFIGDGPAFSQLETPRASPLGKIEQAVGVMKVSVEYSRPGVKGRKVFGELVPFGQVWRTGANEATKITFSDDVMVEGSPVPAGTYSLYTVPGETEWTIIINKALNWGDQHDPKEDVVRFTVKPMKTGRMIETLTISVGDVKDDGAMVYLAWENTLVRFGLKFDVDSKVMAQIDDMMKSPLASVAGNYYQAASYYYNNGKDLNKALEWVSASLDIDADRYWVWRLKSQIQAGLKDLEGAIATAEVAKTKAKDAGNDQFVKYNEDAIAEWKAMLR
ncbi:MAG: DUF2911 domain-containing protein [Ignavibacteria bacterium]|nr:DUF2911 domain-containing protein [Ignavibacteria bacterium]